MDFDFCTSSPRTLDVSQGTARVENLVGLTGPDGKGAWGAVCPDHLTSVGCWRLYR